VSNHQHHTGDSERGLHWDWRFVIGVLLLLVAIVTNLMTLDEIALRCEAAGAPPAAMPVAG
jgi:hypothetical protein